MKKEEWRPVVGYEGLYEVSNLGRVKSLNYHSTGKEGILRQKTTKKLGYKLVTLSKNGKKEFFRVHRLVAQAFIPNQDNLPCINHKDEKPSNNRVDNLEWCTYQYNNCYGDRLKKSAAKKSIKINQYTLDGEFIQEWLSAKEIERQLGFAHENIAKCCKGKIKYAYGFLWKYAA